MPFDTNRQQSRGIHSPDAKVEHRLYISKTHRSFIQNSHHEQDLEEPHESISATQQKASAFPRHCSLTKIDAASKISQNSPTVPVAKA
jgi:hypothetical protein